jgi:hypothetical protein
LSPPKNEFKEIRKFGGFDVPKDNEHQINNVVSDGLQGAVSVLKKPMIAYNQERGRITSFCKGQTKYL